MTRPLTKDVPKGSKLEGYVHRLLKDHQGWEQQWNWDDSLTRSIGFLSLLSDDPRLWVHSRELVRDVIVLPSIAALEGQEAAETMQCLLPQVLDDYVDLICDRAKREATARKRLAPDPDISWAVRAVVMAILYDGYDPAAKANANYVRAARKLGVTRGMVRRIDQHCRRTVRLPGVVEAIFAIQRHLFDANHAA